MYAVCFCPTPRPTGTLPTLPQREPRLHLPYGDPVSPHAPRGTEQASLPSAAWTPALLGKEQRPAGARWPQSLSRRSRTWPPGTEASSSQTLKALGRGSGSSESTRDEGGHASQLPQRHAGGAGWAEASQNHLSVQGQAPPCKEPQGRQSGWPSSCKATAHAECQRLRNSTSGCEASAWLFHSGRWECPQNPPCWPGPCRAIGGCPLGSWAVEWGCAPQQATPQGGRCETLNATCHLASSSRGHTPNRATGVQPGSQPPRAE